MPIPTKSVTIYGRTFQIAPLLFPQAAELPPKAGAPNFGEAVLAASLSNAAPEGRSYSVNWVDAELSEQTKFELLTLIMQFSGFDTSVMQQLIAARRAVAMESGDASRPAN
jgi:hypothetical protein